MRKLIPLCGLMLAVLTGCTSSSNKIADEAFDRALKQQQTITNDLFTMAMQSATDKYCATARAAVASEDPDAAAQAVKDALYECDKITWLTREQQMLAYELFRIPRRYIWEQRGWGSILYKDWQETKSRLNEDIASADDG